MGEFSSHSIDERHDARQEEWTDVFEKQIADGTKNLIDLASHYNYTPERWRIRVDGARTFPEYAEIPQYDHPEDAHILDPAAGETVTMQTVDDVRYNVQYELSATWAFQLNQELQTGDRLRVGLFDDLDGWFLEQNDTHAPQEADFVIRRNGNEVIRETNELLVPTTTFARLRLRTAWYRITRQKWTQSYPKDGQQINEDVARTSPNGDGKKGPSRGNMPLRFEITAGSGTTDLELEAGSCAAVLLGDTRTITRAKNFRETFQVDTANTGYVPVLAMRVNPSNDVVRSEVTNTAIPKFTGAGDAYGGLFCFAEENVRDAGGNQLQDSDFETPAELSSYNSVIETTTAVEQIPDATGTLQTAPDNPGGYQLGFATRYSSGSGGRISTSGTDINAKRVIPDDSLAVLAVKADDTGEMDYEATVEQDF